jgi:DMSO/TMAO reductase YedYZ molybdopterin-dependent catalytic subunit
MKLQLPAKPKLLDKLKLPDNPPPFWPKFTSPLHNPAVTARVGRVLGIFFTICFITGLLSHYQYSPWQWLPEPASPVWGYRLTQGLHVTTGTASIPLLLIKLWTVYPKLFAWPPAKSFLNGIERLSIAVFVTSSLLEVFTGFMNTLDWYPWPWFFTSVHYALAYVVFGSLLIHIAVKLPIIRAGLATPLSVAPRTDPPTPPAEDPPSIEPADDGDHTEDDHDDHNNDADNDPGRTGISRRGLLVASGAGVGLVAATVAGGTVPPLRKIALFSPRRPDHAPQLDVPINRLAAEASTKDVNIEKVVGSDAYRLAFMGPKPFTLTLAEIEALAAVARTFPLSCVEGWSVSAHWAGPTLLDLVRRAGGNGDSHVHVQSIEANGIYNQSDVFGPQLSEAILATHLNGERLTLDHGYPIRLIAPNRAGVLNTKWLKTIEVR